MSDRIIVMYQGEIVEMGNAKNIFNQPQHQYTKNLISSIPKIKRY
jgi:oligopeptide/dipeptide ABC transporter ATP-binding protein